MIAEYKQGEEAVTLSYGPGICDLTGQYVYHVRTRRTYAASDTQHISLADARFAFRRIVDAMIGAL